ncbi:hypothetical protein KJ766_01315, partial [Patescibacteria group bacterium]|nr:hypothetical protein [Patescibacteria group bacterium]
KIVENKSAVQTKKSCSALQKTQKTDLSTTVPVISGVILEEHKNNQEFKNKLTSESSIDDRIRHALQPAREISKKNGFKKSDFDALTDKHLRGVRDPIRTESLLRDKLKLEGEDLQKMMMSLEQARRISQGYDGNAKDNKAFESNQVLPSVEKQKEILNTKHQAMTGTTAQPIAPIAPSAQVSAARTKQHELQIQESKINKEALGVAQQKSAPPRAKVELSAQSAPPVQGDSVKMTDVKFARKLSGPVEELGAMNTTEFRRLSSDPMAAAQKILDKIDLLEDSSYEDRISGVKAWRRNPVNGLYLSMMREALEKGIAVAEVATIRRNTGDESLSPAEIKALMFLNEKIKF